MRISDWSSDVCSSDLVSTNAGGTQVLRWGTMRGLVAGIEAVLPDGSVYDGLAVLKKDNRGYDLTQLLRSEEHTSELQSLMRSSYAVFCLKENNRGIQLLHRHPL